MKEQSEPTKINVGVGEGDEMDAWYFIRVALLAIPWRDRSSPNPKGTFFEESYLVRAKTMASAFKKAERILSNSENLDGTARLGGQRMAFRKIGVLDIEALNEPLESGVQLFYELKAHVRLASVRKRIVSEPKKRRMIAYEAKKGRPPILEVFWGNDFDQL